MYYFYNEMEITWQRGGVPPRCVEMRTKRTRQGGQYPPYRAQMKRTQQGGAMPLPVASKWEQRHEEEGARPSSSRWNGKITTRRGYAPPSLSCQKGNLNTTGRAGALPIMLKWQERDEEGYIPPLRVREETRADIIYYRTHLAKSKNRTDLICTKFKYSTALITSVYF